MFRTKVGKVRRLDVIFATYEERAFCILGSGSPAVPIKPWFATCCSPAECAGCRNYCLCRVAWSPRPHGQFTASCAGPLTLCGSQTWAATCSKNKTVPSCAAGLQYTACRPGPGPSQAYWPPASACSPKARLPGMMGAVAHAGGRARGSSCASCARTQSTCSACTSTRTGARFYLTLFVSCTSQHLRP